MDSENLEHDEEAYSDYEEVDESPLELPAVGFRAKGLFFQPKKNAATERWSAKKAVAIEQLQRSDWQGQHLRIRLKAGQEPLSAEVLQFLNRRLAKSGFEALFVSQTYQRPEQAIDAFLARVEKLGAARLRPLLALGGEHLLDIYESQKEQPAALRRARLIAALKVYGPLRYSPYCCTGRAWQVALVETVSWSQQQHELFCEALSTLDELRYLPEKKAYRLRFHLNHLID